MKISFFKKIYLWFIRFMDKLTKEEGNSDDESDILIAKPERYLINVTLGEFTFTLRVTEKNETEYRQIVKQLNEELEKNKKRYPNIFRQRQIRHSLWHQKRWYECGRYRTYISLYSCRISQTCGR